MSYPANSAKLKQRPSITCVLKLGPNTIDWIAHGMTWPEMSLTVTVARNDGGPAVRLTHRQLDKRADYSI
jgi:hypothetical protein